MTYEIPEGSPLSVRDEAFFVSATVRAAPKGLMLRELFMNAFEAATRSNGEVFAASEAGKLIIINDSEGRDADQLIDMTDLSLSLDKEMGFEDRLNRGEGGKISSLRFNPLGMRYRSRKKGMINEATLFLDKKGRFSRLRYKFDDGSFSEAAPVEPSELTASEQKRYAMFSGDFVEVMLYGQQHEQETAYDPYGDGTNHQKQFVPNEIFSRFYSLPKEKNELKIYFDGDSFRGGASKRRFFTISEVVEKYPTKFEHLKDRWVTLPNGIRLEFIKARSDAKSRSPYNMHSLGRNGSFAAFVWQGEMYNVLQNDRDTNRIDWTRMAPRFVLAGMADTLCMLVHLPPKFCEDMRYREGLIRKDNNEPVRWDDFETMIIQNRPKWLKDMVDAKRGDSGRMKNAAEQLRNLAIAMNLQMRTERAAQKVAVTIGDNTGHGSSPPGGPPTGEGPPKVNNPDNNGGIAQGNGTGPFGGMGIKKSKVEKPNGKSKSLIYPNPIWCDPENTEYPQPDLVNRGAQWMHSSRDLYLNIKYEAFDQIMDAMFTKLLEKQPHLVRTPELEGHMRYSVKFFITMSVGKAVLRAIYKKGNWTDRDIRQCLTEEALTGHYEATYDQIADIIRSFKNTPEVSGFLKENNATNMSVAA